MLLRQDRFHIHPILCAKIVQGERKTEQTERKMKFTSIFPRRSRFYPKSKNKIVSQRHRVAVHAALVALPRTQSGEI